MSSILPDLSAFVPQFSSSSWSSPSPTSPTSRREIISSSRREFSPSTPPRREIISPSTPPRREIISQYGAPPSTPRRIIPPPAPRKQRSPPPTSRRMIPPPTPRKQLPPQQPTSRRMVSPPRQKFKTSQPPPTPRKINKSREPMEPREQGEFKFIYKQFYPTTTNRVIENFELLDKRKIGGGDYGDVYAISNPYADLLTTKNIAVKKLKRKSPLELKSWATITDHCGLKRHTLPLLGAWASNTGTGDEVTYFSSPLCEATLGDYISKARSANELRMVLPDMVDALKCIRNSHIYHRDIKPENIFYCGGLWVLGDFGISIDEKDYATSRREKIDVGSGGAGEYMAKKDIFGQVSKTPGMSGTLSIGYNYSSDIYSLGMVMQKIFKLIPLDSEEERQVLKELIIAMTNEDYQLRPSLEEISERIIFLEK